MITQQYGVPRFRSLRPQAQTMTGEAPHPVPGMPGQVPMPAGAPPAPVAPGSPGVMPVTQINTQTTGPNQSAVNPLPAPGSANFRRDTFVPGSDPRLSGAQGATDRAGAAVQGAPSFSQSAGAGADRFRSIFGTGQVQSLHDPTAPNRTQLAQQALADFDTQDLENRTKRYRSMTQNAAGAGRLGMMDEARGILDTERSFNQDRSRFANELARSVSEGDIADRFRRVEFDTGVHERNADRSFGRARAAADYGGRDASNDLADLYDRYGQAGDLEDRVFNQGYSNRGEYRGERDYMNRVEQQDLDNRVRQRELENAELDARIRQAIAQSMAGRG